MSEHFDTADLADAIASATWDTEVDSDPMVVTSVRLPRSLLDWVREQAAREQVKPTALIRRWIEDRRHESDDSKDGDEPTVARLADRVTRLEALALRTASPEPGDDGGMADLLAALHTSVATTRAERASGRPDEERRGA